MSEAQSASLEQGSGEQYWTVVGSGMAHSAPGAQAMLSVGRDSDLHSQFVGQSCSPQASARAATLTAKGERAASKEKLSRTQVRLVGMRKNS
jgi:hypothetical protein